MGHVVIGVDVHKRSHTCVAINSVGQDLAATTVEATPDGCRAALQWAHNRFPGTRSWGVEDLRVLSAGLVAELIACGEEVVRVAPRLTARHRSSARSYGKSDPIDALAIARAVLREADLPTAERDQTALEVKLLVDRREHLIAMRTATMTRLLWRLHELEPEYPHVRKLRYALHRDILAANLRTRTGVLVGIARDELADLDHLSRASDDVGKIIEAMVRKLAPSLLDIDGCGPLSAAKIYGETAGISRFATVAKYARYCGTAPVPRWSSNTPRLTRSNGGNRNLNQALHTIAVVQIRPGGRGRDYYRHRIDGGDSHAQALRSLKRLLCRVVYQRLKSEAIASSSGKPRLEIKPRVQTGGVLRSEG